MQTRERPTKPRRRTRRPTSPPSSSRTITAAELLMPFDPDRCPFTAAWRVIGGKWRGVLWWRLSLGIGRFGQLRRSVPQITKKVLTQELRALERAGIASRREQPGSVTTVEYALTEYGKSLAKVMEVICAWGQEHLVKRDGT